MFIFQNIFIMGVFISSIFFASKKRYEPLLVLVIIATINAPLLKISNISLPFYYLSFFPLIVAVLSLGWKIIPYSLLREPVSIYPIMIFAVILVSLFSTFLIVAQTNLTENLLVGAFRGMFFRLIWLLLVTILLSRLTTIDLQNLISIIITILAIANLIACLIQVFFGFPEIFHMLYYSPSITPLEVPLTMGRFTRSFGLFPSTVTLGPFALVIGAIALAFRKQFVFFLSIVIAILSLSKTALLGFPIIIFIWLLLNIIGFRRDNLRLISSKTFMFVLVSFVSVFFLLVLTDFMKERGFYVDYYFQFLQQPLQALGTRYNPALESSLKETHKVIREYPLLGTGFTTIRNEFVGDSTYLILLKHSGIVGLLIYGTAMAYIIWFLIKKQSMLILLPLASMVSGIGFPAWISLEHMFFIQSIIVLESKRNNSSR